MSTLAFVGDIRNFTGAGCKALSDFVNKLERMSLLRKLSELDVIGGVKGGQSRC